MGVKLGRSVRGMAFDRIGPRPMRNGSCGNNESAFQIDVRSADECAMAEILVLDVRARRLSAAGNLFLQAVDMTG